MSALQRNANRTPLKRRFDNRGSGGRIGDFQEDRNRYAPPQKRSRSQSQSQGRVPLYHHGSNMSRVSNCGDVIHSNSSNSFPPALRSHDSSLSYANYQKPLAYGNPNPQLVPLPLPYRKLDDFDSLPEWSPNQSLNQSHPTNFPISRTNFVPGVRFNGQPPYQAPVFTNFPNPMPVNHSNMVPVVSQAMPVNHSNMVPVVSQAMPQQPVVSKGLADMLSALNNENVKQNQSPLGLSFDSVKLSVRNESAIKSLYSDIPRQCTSCGNRFKLQEDHSKHMDWHVRKNRMAKEANRTNGRKPNKSRVWYPSASLFLSAGDTEAAKPCFNNANGEAQMTRGEVEDAQQNQVPADLNQPMCALCEEAFENFFSHEADDWMYKDAVYLKELGPIVHAKCMPEPRRGSSKASNETKITAVTIPSVASALVC